jgi:hypothetical protein
MEAAKGFRIIFVISYIMMITERGFFMKSLKKTVSLWLAAMMLVSLAACGSNSAVDDTSVMEMSFKSPEGYETVERSVEKNTEGKLTGKSIGYTFEDGRSVAFAFSSANGQSIEDELEQMEVERKEYNGTELVLYQSGKKTYMAFCQKGDNVYGVQYRSDNEETLADEFDKILKTVKFSDAKKTAMNDFVLDKVTYELKTDIPLYSETTNLKEKADGTVVSKSFIWKYSEDSEKVNYRFSIEQRKDTKLEDLLDEDKEYDTTEINGTTFTFAKEGEDTDALDHNSYYVERGGDVYLIQNKGVSTGWFTSRSDESKAAFKTFIQSIVFK